jgi:hypothetical protein
MAVDWFSGLIGYDARRLKLGRMVRFTAAGDVEWDIDINTAVQGSWSSQMLIGRRRRTDSMSMAAARRDFVCGRDDVLSVSGNPTKFLQGHNVFGPSVSELGSVLREAVRAFPADVRPPDADDERWPALHRQRVDVAVGVDLGSHRAVHEWLNGAATLTRSRHGRPMVSGTTVYWGKNSRRWSIKAYCKFCELKDHPPERFFDELRAFCESQIRIELTLRTLELKPRGTLTEDVIWEYWRRVVIGVPKLSVTKIAEVDGAILTSDMPVGAKQALLLWITGTDVRFTLQRRTFYKYRGLIRAAFGIDIASPRDDQAPQLEPLGYDVEFLKEHEVKAPPEGLQPLLFRPPAPSPHFLRNGRSLTPSTG